MGKPCLLSGNDCWLVVSNPLKNMKVNWDDIPNIWENKKCSKAPTSCILSGNGYIAMEKCTSCNGKTHTNSMAMLAM